MQVCPVEGGGGRRGGWRASMGNMRWVGGLLGCRRSSDGRGGRGVWGASG